MNAPALAKDATPAQRLWGAVRYIETHPDEYNQNTFGEALPDGRTIGCVAHHIVRMAGLTPVQHCASCHGEGRGYVALSELRELYPQIAEEWMERYGPGAEDSAPVLDYVAHALLGRADVGPTFYPGRSLSAVKDEITARFGPDPLGPVIEVLDGPEDTPQDAPR